MAVVLGRCSSASAVAGRGSRALYKDPGRREVGLGMQEMCEKRARRLLI